jgi:hypothetical protein
VFVHFLLCAIFFLGGFDVHPFYDHDTLPIGFTTPFFSCVVSCDERFFFNRFAALGGSAGNFHGMFYHCGKKLQKKKTKQEFHKWHRIFVSL